MMYTSLCIKKALCFAAEKHNGQYRKGTFIPYIIHPVQVALGVSTYTNDEEIITVAFLHDLLEESAEVSIALLQKEFGDRVASMVNEVSYVLLEKSKTWKEKKELYLKKIKKASKDALIVVAVDKICNMQTYFNILREKDKKITHDLRGTKDEYLWYYDAVYKVLISKFGNNQLTKDYNKMLIFYKKENL